MQGYFVSAAGAPPSILVRDKASDVAMYRGTEASVLVEGVVEAQYARQG